MSSEGWVVQVDSLSQEVGKVTGEITMWRKHGLWGFSVIEGKSVRYHEIWGGFEGIERKTRLLLLDSSCKIVNIYPGPNRKPNVLEIIKWTSEVGCPIN